MITRVCSQFDNKYLFSIKFISRQITGSTRQGQCCHFNTLHTPWKKSFAFVSVSKQSSLSTQNQTAMLFTKQQDIAKTDPVKGDLVYIGTITKKIRYYKGFSLSSSAIGLVMLPFILEKALSAKPVLGIIGLLLSNVFIFIKPVLNHIVTKRYVTKIYLKRDEGVFTATTYSFFLREKEHKFKASDVTVPKIPGMLTSLKIHGETPLYIDSDLFIDKSAFVQMMKYDEPLDWEITDKKENKKVEKTN